MLWEQCINRRTVTRKILLTWVILPHHHCINNKIPEITHHLHKTLHLLPFCIHLFCWAWIRWFWYYSFSHIPECLKHVTSRILFGSFFTWSVTERNQGATCARHSIRDIWSWRLINNLNKQLVERRITFLTNLVAMPTGQRTVKQWNHFFFGKTINCILLSVWCTLQMQLGTPSATTESISTIPCSRSLAQRT